MLRTPRTCRTIVAGFSVAVLATACGGDGGGTNADGEWEPERPIDLIAPADTGGGWDMLARTTARVLEENDMVDSIQVENQPGAGGAIAWAGIANTPDDAHRLFVTSPPIILVPLSGESEYTYDDFTPLSALATEYMTYVVPEDSELETFQDLVDAIDDDPEAISIGGGSAPGSMDHVALAGAVHAAGGEATDVNYIPHDGGGEAITSMIGGHLEAVVTGVGEAIPMVDAGEARMLAVSAPETLDDHPDVPTLNDEGIDYTFDIWRGVMGPPDITDEQVEYYEDLFSEMVESDAWQEERENLGWEDSYMNSADFGAFLDEVHEDSLEILDEVGLVNEQD
ncbi:tripartite tricarboxylate transporter substrate binding protein [Spiractinospora alimapuensis]|uniref:tripartite tricarboxylate transporter substrate binding protein n=1 Tax=Spiractinospora alimapuensis TaxID=2820884 RepID=UPI001F433FAA|nr:tripartite tricarboxylate transporter substrate-binding protein [Spiractinospora alimapuensis]QVQ54560.1 tripartite tricarboxylate transporter substrate binding protein [Spiractinospora alimapuensis]